MPLYKEGLTKKQEYLISQSEKLMNGSLEDLEHYLDYVGKTYTETLQVIINKIESFYKRYEQSPDSIRQYQIQNVIRLEKIALQIETRMTQLGLEYTDTLKGLLTDNFVKAVHVQNDALNTAWGTNVNADSFTFLNTTAVEMAVMYGYNNYNFEVDFKGRTKQFNRTVNNIIADGVAQGEGIHEISQRLKKEMDLHIFHAKRIARTETSRVLNDASLKTYDAMGVKQIQWLDSTEAISFYHSKGGKKVKSVVCHNCRDNATGGKNGDGVYPLNEVPPIPAHPHCRCTVAPYYGEDNNY